MSDAAIRNGVHCRDCGTIISPTAPTCPRCGGRQMNSSGFGGVTPSGKSRLAAALLAFFLGGFGVHKFYLGRVGQGILYLLFFWTFIPAIVAFVEMIIYLTMTDEAFAAKYG
jgi:TM2 domain-containing membrane protein YozV